MTETQEVAQGMLAAYLAYLARASAPTTVKTATAYVRTDAILCHESQTVRDAISEELHKLAVTAQAPEVAALTPTDQTDADLNQAARNAGFRVVPHGDFWIAKDPNGQAISAPLTVNHDAWAQVRRVHAGLTHTEQTAHDAYWTAHAKALELISGGGTFAALIGQAFTRADKTGAARLIAAFPELLAD